MIKLIVEFTKAMLNATLLLLAICLFFAWKVTSSVNAATDRVATAVADVTPVQDRLTDLRDEIAALRTDIATRPEIEITTRMDMMNRRLDTLQQNLNGLQSLPADMIQQAAQAGAAELAGQIARMGNCSISAPNGKTEQAPAS